MYGLRDIFTINIMTQLYNSLIFSYIDYCLEAWGRTYLEVWGRTYLEVWGRTYLEAWGRTYLEVWGRTYLEVWGRTYLEVWGRTYLEVWGRTYLEAWGRTYPTNVNSVYVNAEKSNRRIFNAHYEHANKYFIELNI